MKQSRMALNALMSAVVVLLAGCSMAPKYETPAAPVGQVVGAYVPSIEVKNVAWRDLMSDKRLQKVIELALANNRDLRVSLLNVEQARAQYQIQQAEYLPSLGVTASHSKARALAGSEGQTQVTQSAGLSVGIVSWELDLFGRIASLKGSALERYLATEQAAKAAQVSLIAEVASRWAIANAYQARLILSHTNESALEEVLALTLEKQKLGAASLLDVSQMQAKVEAARATRAAHYTALEQARNALDLVVGTKVDPALLKTEGEKPFAGLRLQPVPEGLSSDLLLQRPDIQAAEHALKAANANVGAARAAFFPSIRLSAALGRTSDALDNLVDGSRTWSFMPSVTVPIFNAGALKSSLDVAKIQKDIHVAQYEKSIQTAFYEVADALSQYQGIAEQITAHTELLAAAKQTQNVVDQRWQHGLSNKLQALDAFQAVLNAEQAVLTTKLSEVLNRITLYKVLGGDPA